MYNMEHSPSRYYQMIHNYQEAQLLFAAVRLNIFSYLDTPTTAEAIAKILNCNKQQLELLLLSLVSCGLISRLGNFYANTPETKDFLSRNSDVFLGEALLFREKMTSLDGLELKLKADQKLCKKNYDFAALAKATIPEMYTGRVQSFIEKMEKLFPDPQRPLRVLDLGGGTGVLAIEFTKHFPGSRANVFETPEVAAITKDIIRQQHSEKSVGVLAGNFNTDDFGGVYDLIIASGILNFVEGDLSCFIQKLSSALRDGGYLLVIGQYIDHDYDAPANMLSWLSGFLDGVPLPPSDREMEAAIKKAGLKTADILKDTIFEGQLYRKGTADLSVCSGDVVRSFIELTEQIANSKTNILDFGSEDMTFYRGEIHMIKMIGDFPGIYSAELARKFGITRPVVHTTLQKLSERELIIKEDDENDKKRYRLYLTEKGWTAYRFHQKYHEENDRTLFDYLSDMPGDQLASIKGFLDQAITLIYNHA